MELLEARQLARMLMREHGLEGWRFMFDRARRRFGCCHYRKKLITLSGPLVLLNGEGEVRDTILHEIAHALVPGDGHGRRWRAKCVEIGATPAGRFSEEDVATPPRAESRYALGCVGCGWWVDRRRLSANGYVCRRCGGRLVYREKGTGREFVVAEGVEGLAKRFIADCQLPIAE